MVTGYEMDVLRARQEQVRATRELATAITNLKDAVILAIAKLSAEVND